MTLEALDLTHRCSSIAAAPCLSTSMDLARLPVSSVALVNGTVCGVVAGRDGLDRAFERLNRVDDAAEREETEHAGQQERRRVGDDYIPAGFFNRLERGSSRVVSKAPVVFDPLAGYLAERDTRGSNVGLERGEGIVLPPFLGQRHHVAGFDDVLPAQIPEIAEEPAVAPIADQRIAVLLKQLREDSIVFIERRARLGSLSLIGGKQEAAHVHPDFGEASRNVAEHRNSGELRLRDEPAALLDSLPAGSGQRRRIRAAQSEALPAAAAVACQSSSVDSKSTGIS